MKLSRRLFFASPLAASLDAHPPGTLVPMPEIRKRLLIVFNPDYIDMRSGHSLGSWLASQGYEAAMLVCVGYDKPDIRIFDLDGAPSLDTGLLQEVKALLEEAKR